MRTIQRRIANLPTVVLAIAGACAALAVTPAGADAAPPPPPPPQDGAAEPVGQAEGDWYTRVERLGLEEASRRDVALYERGILRADVHVGECYRNLGRWEEAAEVFARAARSRDRNYAAYATARRAEALAHLGREDRARKMFRGVLDEHPTAWFEGSVSALCRSWLSRLGDSDF